MRVKCGLDTLANSFFGTRAVFLGLCAPRDRIVWAGSGFVRFPAGMCVNKFVDSLTRSASWVLWSISGSAMIGPWILWQSRALRPPCHHLCDNFRLCNKFTMNSRTVSCAAATHAVKFATVSGSATARTMTFATVSGSLSSHTMNSATVSGSVTVPWVWGESQALRRFGRTLYERLRLCDDLDPELATFFVCKNESFLS